MNRKFLYIYYNKERYLSVLLKELWFFAVFIYFAIEKRGSLVSDPVLCYDAVSIDYLTNTFLPPIMLKPFCGAASF